ncbi:LysR family transcriptional regulator [Paenibacillus sp. MMO-58]|uniref:LysR family transcriptional regulator n=1 Tax=Paenibacillus sp. MMO-58 TaxID=3081290 RepID=UPI00301AC6B8
MNIEFIEGFLETVNQKSIAKASQKLQISHPALSKQIRSIEAYFGVTLFKRSSTGVELTEVGKTFYNRIVPVFTEISSIKTDMVNVNNIQMINLGTLPSLAANYLPEVIFELKNKNIEVKVTIRNTSMELYQMLKCGELDGAVLQKDAVHSSIWNADLFIEPYYAVVYPTHRLSKYPSVTLHDIANEPLILNPPDCSIRRLLTSLMLEEGLHPQIETEVCFNDFILGYVAAGAGITFVPKIVSEHIVNHSLVSIPLNDARARRTISLLSQSEDIGKFLRPYLRKA